jgi:uncharacterized membrane-anchored protein YhcB (DUF1043 family)
MRRCITDEDTRNDKARKRATEKRKKQERRHVRNSKRYYSED